MLAIFFLPLPDQDGPARPEHLHAAFSGWFDAPGVQDHWANDKPYTVSPVTVRDGVPGVEIRVLTVEAEQQLRAAAAKALPVRLGAHRSRVGEPQRLAAASWDELASGSGSVWRVEFLAPTTFRTNNRYSPMPTAPVVLRAPAQAWQAFTPGRVEPLSHAEQATIWVSDVDLRTENVELAVPRRDKRKRISTVPAVLGHVVFRCDDPAAAAKAAPFFRLASFCGVGSDRGRGMGVVSVEEGT